MPPAFLYTRYRSQKTAFTIRKIDQKAAFLGIRHGRTLMCGGTLSGLMAMPGKADCELISENLGQALPHNLAHRRGSVRVIDQFSPPVRILGPSTSILSMTPRTRSGPWWCEEHADRTTAAYGHGTRSSVERRRNGARRRRTDSAGYASDSPHTWPWALTRECEGRLWEVAPMRRADAGRVSRSRADSVRTMSKQCRAQRLHGFEIIRRFAHTPGRVG